MAEAVVWKMMERAFALDIRDGSFRHELIAP
jgi:hypothetical protein